MRWKTCSLEWRTLIAHHLDQKAATLSFYTLLSIVPLLAIAFGIAQSFGIEAYLRAEIENLLLDHPEVAEKLMQFVQAALSYIHVNLLTATALIFFFWSSVTLLYHVEAAMNAIWAVHSPRPFWRRLGLYVALILLLSPYFAIIGSLLFFFENVLLGAAHLMGFGPNALFFQLAVTGIGFVSSWLFCALLIALMPNCYVPLGCACKAGIISGSLFQLLQWSYFYLQHLLTNYSIIYGSFAAFPLFLLWLQISWSLLFLGAFLASKMNICKK